MQRGLLKIIGQDSQKFLQSLITADLKKDKESFYSFLLTPKGKYLFDFFVIKISEGYIIDCAYSDKESLKQLLSKYKLFAKIEIVDISDEYYILYSNKQHKDCLSYKDTRFEKLGYRHLYKEQNDSYEQYMQDKYDYAIIDGHIDMVKEKSIILEYGANALGAVSFNKGCYLGQELISRTYYTGVIRKAIYILSNVDALNPGEDIIENDKKIGIICSCYKDKAIALIKEDSKTNIDKYKKAPWWINDNG